LLAIPLSDDCMDAGGRAMQEQWPRLASHSPARQGRYVFPLRATPPCPPLPFGSAMIRPILVAHPAGAFASHSAPGRMVPSRRPMSEADALTLFSHPSFCWPGLPADTGIQVSAYLVAGSIRHIPGGLTSRLPCSKAGSGKGLASSCPLLSTQATPLDTGNPSEISPG
jgi:hypothetical protein